MLWVPKPSLGNSEQPYCFCSWRSVQTLLKDFPDTEIIFLFLSICQERFLQEKVGWEPPHPALQHPPPHPPPPLAPRALRTSGMTDKGYHVPALCAAELL